MELPLFKILYNKKSIKFIYPLILFLFFYTIDEGATKPEGAFLFALKVSVFTTIITLINYKILSPFLLLKNRIVVYLSSVVCMLVVIHILEIYLPQLFFPLWIYDTDLTTMVWYVIAVVISVQYKTIDLWCNDSMESTNDKQARLKMELDFLKSQFNPHFLFNALNNIYSLVNKNDYRAAPMLITLSNLLRYSLYEGGQPHVRLVKEVDYIESFIQLQMLRDIKSHTIDFYIEGVNKMVINLQ